jgi:hypothetical protein
VDGYRLALAICAAVSLAAAAAALLLPKAPPAATVLADSDAVGS